MFYYKTTLNKISIKFIEFNIHLYFIYIYYILFKEYIVYKFPNIVKCYQI